MKVRIITAELTGSGNTCHVQLRLPKGSEAVWGAKDAFDYVEEKYGHEKA